jgi:protein KIBRA
MRLQYDEARKRIQMIQQQLADLEEKVTPGQAESDKDRFVAMYVDTIYDLSVV